MRRNLLFSALAFALCVGLFSLNAFATGTAASAQGPVFQGAPTVPSLTLATGVTLTTCVGDGGFTNCTTAPQTLSIAQLQATTCTAGPGANCVLLGAQPSPNDGGAALPNLNASTVLLAFPVLQDNARPTTCNVALSAFFNDGGDAVITCAPDAGVINVLRLN